MAKATVSKVQRTVLNCLANGFMLEYRAGLWSDGRGYYILSNPPGTDNREVSRRTVILLRRRGWLNGMVIADAGRAALKETTP